MVRLIYHNRFRNGIIRFWNNDVLNLLDAVLEELHAQLMGRHTPSSALSGTFSLREKVC
jgi:very-short-patch-repair endonuclease